VHFPSGDAVIVASFFQAILSEFRGKIVPGGFSMTDPTPGGLGEWVQNNSAALNLTRLTPRHGFVHCGQYW